MAALAQLSYEDWANLPDIIIVNVLLHLPATDICHAGSTCKHWRQCSKEPVLWRFVNVSFCLPDHRKRVQVFKQYGHFLQGMRVVLDQGVIEFRKTITPVLKHMSRLKNINMSHLSIICFGDLPSMGLDNGSHEFLTALAKLLSKFGKTNDKSTLKHLNLHGLQAPVNDHFIENISANCPNLEYLNIVNYMLHCFISPQSIINLVLKCNKLVELHLPYAILSDDFLVALAQPDRTPLKKLEISCSANITYNKNSLSSDAWKSLRIANQDLKVTLEFCTTYPHILGVMKPEIPVQEVVFTKIIQAILCQLINTAVLYYGHMLEKLVITFRPGGYIPTGLLLNVARNCRKLRTLYIPCQLESNIIDEILELCPLLRDYRFVCVWSSSSSSSE